MPWTDLLTPFPGGNRRLALTGFRASLKKLDSLVEAVISDEEALDNYWADIVKETALLKGLLISTEEREWNRTRQRDARNPRLVHIVRERDGDICRYCGVTVDWVHRGSSNAACYSHINVGQGAKTPDDMVVSCVACDKLRSQDYAEGK
ncbi:hypothetical protein, partial [Rothia sp. P5766]|uniref:hypothetical protein n=1 Tax=Rothia sp. P5766 TaxID=3402656 RepID=UPI003AEDA97E